MELLRPLAALSAALIIIVLAARQMGGIFARLRLPLISGFLFAGILTGPFVLDFVHTESIGQLLPLDEMSLAFIAFAAGAELELKVIRGYLRSIVALIGGQVIAVMALGIGAFLLIQDRLSFMAGLPENEVMAIALLGATIMIARSPSSAIAIIKELRARGPFTHKVLGATVLMDAVVIVVFTASVSVAAALIEGVDFDVRLLLFVAFEILLDIGLGVLLGLLLRSVVRLPYDWLKMAVILLLGLSIFLLSTLLHDFHPAGMPIAFFSEPLLICMVAGFYVTNFTARAAEFQHIIEEMAPAVFLLFFTLVGIELELDVIRLAWGFVLFLVVVRMVGIFIGAYLGLLTARDNSPGNALLGFGYLTQAGVSVGLAKEIGVEFSSWGPGLATLSIGVIVVNQIIGPPLLKWAINRVGESHTRAEGAEHEGGREALIFGVEGQSLALARQLRSNHWTVRLATRHPDSARNQDSDAPHIEVVSDYAADTLAGLGLGRVECAVLMLSDEENLRLCELIYERFGIENVVVRLQDHGYMDQFQALGARVVEPGTAMVGLLDQLVRSPYSTSIFMGMEPDETIRDVEVANPQLAGVFIRDLRLPHDVLIIAILRGGDRLLCHGYTQLEVGDRVTLVGSRASLEDVELKLEV
ncbi:MAG: cation:proton antiporter [Caldilineaceae bacterium]|nr:cation:proton antiporter [Caldilineaceae bacterium]